LVKQIYADIVLKKFSNGPIGEIKDVTAPHLKEFFQDLLLVGSRHNSYSADEAHGQRGFAFDLNLLTASAPRSFRAIEPGSLSAWTMSPRSRLPDFQSLEVPVEKDHQDRIPLFTDINGT
jgi:hypothetical protein